MRYRLRTLLIVLALGPPMLALAWVHSETFADLFVLACLAALLGVSAAAVLWTFGF